jgi:hypothetical protein
MSYPFFGLDVSYCQALDLVPWENERIDFGIVRATHGATVDVKAEGHCARIHAAKKRLGLYAFFEPAVSAEHHAEAFHSLADKVGFGVEGDLLPAVDLEAYPGHPVTKAWDVPAGEFVDLLEEIYLAPPLLYLTFGTWVAMGRPLWVTRCNFWIPRYPFQGHPFNLTPPPPSVVPGGNAWSIWQYGAGKLFGGVQEDGKPYSVDQNHAQCLPLVGGGVLR